MAMNPFTEMIRHLFVALFFKTLIGLDLGSGEVLLPNSIPLRLMNAIELKTGHWTKSSDIGQVARIRPASRPEYRAGQ
jgi:hypothetical protein